MSQIDDNRRSDGLSAWLDKSDLEDEREVDKAEVQAATRNWQVKYFETSAVSPYLHNAREELIK